MAQNLQNVPLNEHGLHPNQSVIAGAASTTASTTGAANFLSAKSFKSRKTNGKRKVSSHNNFASNNSMVSNSRINNSQLLNFEQMQQQLEGPSFIDHNSMMMAEMNHHSDIEPQLHHLVPEQQMSDLNMPNQFITH